MIWEKGDYWLSDNKEDQDIEAVYALLRTSYWAANRSREVIELVMSHSLCFSLRKGEKYIGFVRVVSDYGSTSWVSDMIVDPGYRGEGLGRWMMEQVMNHPKIKHTQFALQTKDAHSFYEKLGFAQRPVLMSTSSSYL